MSNDTQTKLQEAYAKIRAMSGEKKEAMVGQNARIIDVFAKNNWGAQNEYALAVFSVVAYLAVMAGNENGKETEEFLAEFAKAKNKEIPTYELYRGLYSKNVIKIIDFLRNSNEEVRAAAMSMYLAVASFRKDPTLNSNDFLNLACFRHVLTPQLDGMK